MLCPSCHTENRDNARFCKKCGLHFNDEQSAQALPEQIAGVVKPPEAQPEPASPPVPPEAAAPQEVPTETQGINGNSDVEDISQAPTQFLTHQQMMEYHKHKWEQDLEREKWGAKSSTQTRAHDIADQPTMYYGTGQ